MQLELTSVEAQDGVLVYKSDTENGGAMQPLAPMNEAYDIVTVNAAEAIGYTVDGPEEVTATSFNDTTNDGPPLSANDGAFTRVPKNTELPQVNRSVVGTVKVLTAAVHCEDADTEACTSAAELNQADAGAVSEFDEAVNEKH